MTDRYLILAKQLRRCVTCKAPTFWVTNTQLRHGTRPNHEAYGLCLDHAWSVPGLEAVTFAQAFRTAMSMTPETERMPPEPPVDELDDPWRVRCPWVRADVTWTFHVPLKARHVGPCSRCRRRISRYGVRGSALCPDCRNRIELTKGHRHGL